MYLEAVTATSYVHGIGRSATVTPENPWTTVEHSIHRKVRRVLDHRSRRPNKSRRASSSEAE
jgi:hypothetical protein